MRLVAQFLDASQQPGFTESSTFGRVLTLDLELAAQALGSVSRRHPNLRPIDRFSP
jgi:hypothetical protein